MSGKTFIRAVFNDSNVATGSAEFQTGDFISITRWYRCNLSIGSAGPGSKVNSGGSELRVWC